MKNLIYLFFGLLIFASCDTQKNATQTSNMENSSIENVRWTLIEFDGKPVPASVAGKVGILLSEENKALSGSNGCNRIMSNYKISNGMQISFSDVASTVMACPNQNWDENEFNKALETANNFSVSGDKLMLNIGKRMPLAVFAKVTENGITNKYWKLKKLEGKEVAMADNQEREQYFIIRSDGTITGFAGCNQFSGNYTSNQDDLRISFDQVRATLRACPDVEVNESEFLEVFELTDNYTVDGDKLMLNVGRRSPLAEFEAVYF